MAAADATAWRLLTRHFIRRLLDNDLLSSHADRHEAVSMSCTALISTSLFISVLLSAKYIMAPFPTPAMMALISLDDKFLFTAASMLVSALVALAQWDALPLDARDTSILGPLPIARSVVVRAKLSALVVFVSGFALVLNVGPSVLFSLFFMAQMPIGVAGIATLIATHFLVTSAAGAFGLLSVVGVREALRLLLGARAFQRVSTAIQAALVVLCVTALLMLPATASRVRRWALAAETTVPYVVPPVWFVGLYESLAGHVLDDLPRRRVPRRIAMQERDATATYRAHRSLFHELAALAWSALGAAVLVGIAAFAWNNRRLPAPMAMRRRPRTSRAFIPSMFSTAGRTLVRGPVAQAGFFFTLQTLPRSIPHRLAMATAVAIAVALSLVSTRGVTLESTSNAPEGPLALWAIQTMVLGILLLGFRHAVRIPANLGASWSFHLAWSGDDRSYLSGVKQAALVGVAGPVVVLLWPLHGLALGPRLALAHMLCGLLLARVSIDLMFLGLRQPPFASSYVPAGSLKMTAPILITGLSILMHAFAALERFALGEQQRAAAFFIALLGVAAGVRALDVWQRHGRVAVALDEGPAPATQRFDLSG